MSNKSLRIKGKKSNNSFELIAIEILDNANSEYIKTLKKNEIYYFNNDYEITNDGIKYNPTVNIYNFSNDLSINISAIVGKNGSGKSTLVELLFLAINSISNCVEKGLSVIDKSLEGMSIYYKIDDVVYKISFSDKMKTKYLYKDDKFSYNSKAKIKNNLDIEKEFFYTIAVNYSQHSLNAKYMGDWLNKLFHKNDAYQTPIVIEPFRKDGNIDVNRQDELVKSRLLVNLLEPTNDDVNFRQLTEYLEAADLEFSLNINKVQFVFDDIGFNMYGKEYIEKYLIIFFNLLEIDINVNLDLSQNMQDDIVSNIALLYIFKKLINIILTYKQYKKYHFYLKDAQIYKFENHIEYFKNLMNDKSHITFKLRQAINFIKYKHIDINSETHIDDLSIKIAKIIENDIDEKIEFLLPPSFLKTELILQNKDSNEKILFHTLSSGEKQKIYSINSIMYHLTNINSVLDNFSKNLLGYRNINILLDEIELYFHPEMQREYINYLLNMIKLLKEQGRIENIESINFLFITHSPFILSDIPQNNVLFLRKDKNDTKTRIDTGTKTFGANIHDLLINGFFISETIGAYVKQQIDEILQVYNKKDMEKYIKNREKYRYIQNSLGEPYIANIISNYLEDLERIVNVKD